MMKTQYYSFIQYTGVLLCSMLLLFSCSKDDGADTEPIVKTALVLTASATEIDKGDEVTFEVTAGGEAVDADIYINNTKISGANHTFEEAGILQVVAKKEGYTDSEAIEIKSYQVDVYVAGYKSTGRGTIAVYWKNGTAVHLPSGSIGGEASAITVHGEDVYVSGFTSHGNRRVTYWKNGTAVHLSDGTWMAEADAIVVDGNDVYVAGFESTGSAYRATYWKNGTAVHLTDGSISTMVTAIVVAGGDIYVSAYESPSIARYWKNGEAIFSGAPGTAAYDITVNGSDVYLAGNWRYGSLKPMYWKNGTPIPLSDGTPSDAGDGGKAIVVSGDDIHVAGTSYATAFYWKNGTGVPLYDLNDGRSAAYDIAVDADDIYIAGRRHNGSELVATYWKNGTLITLEENVRSEARSIFVTRSLEGI